jgi:ubiquinone/menaquinone biosynthesis C-methylase UbiE
VETKSHWDERAADPRRDDLSVTHNDIWQRWLEIALIKPLLRPADRVIDVGCGAGYATRLFAPLVGRIVGVDFSEGMIVRAKAALEIDNLSYAVADVRRLSEAGLGLFDTALSIRCLINILDWEQQKLALDEIAAVLRPGGRLILVEGKAEGRAALNEERQANGLDPMPVVTHNLDFSEPALLDHLARHFALSSKRGFGRYDYVSRVVHPRLVRPAEPKYDAEINERAAREAVSDNSMEYMSRVIFLVLTRK